MADIYDDNHLQLVDAALAAIQRCRRNYIPDVPVFGEQLKAAVDVALAVRRAWSLEGVKLREFPLANNPEWPSEQDFIRLEQWFGDTHTAIAKEIARGSEPIIMRNQKKRWSRGHKLALAAIAATVLGCVFTWAGKTLEPEIRRLLGLSSPPVPTSLPSQAPPRAK